MMVDAKLKQNQQSQYVICTDVIKYMDRFRK